MFHVKLQSKLITIIFRFLMLIKLVVKKAYVSRETFTVENYCY